MIIEHRSENRIANAPHRGSSAERAWKRRSGAGSRRDWTLAVGSFLGLIGLIAGLQALSAPSRNASDLILPRPAAPR